MTDKTNQQDDFRVVIKSEDIDGNVEYRYTDGTAAPTPQANHIADTSKMVVPQSVLGEDELRLIRKLGALIPQVGGETFANDPPDAILDAAIRVAESLHSPQSDALDAMALTDAVYAARGEGWTTRRQMIEAAIRAYLDAVGRGI